MKGHNGPRQCALSRLSTRVVLKTGVPVTAHRVQRLQKSLLVTWTKERNLQSEPCPVCETCEI
eukprot:985834-Rhodomonas_salina.1